jgi:predicted double-glycine peptidase
MTVATKIELQLKTKAFIVEAMQEILEDPDFGYKFTEKAKRRLKEATKPAKKSISLSKIKGKYY